MQRVRLFHKEKIQRQNNFNSMLLLDTEQLEKKKSLLNRGGSCILCAFQYHRCCTRRDKKTAFQSQGHRRNIEPSRVAGGEPCDGDALASEAWHLQLLCYRHQAQAVLTHPHATQLHPQTARIKQQESSAPSQKVHPTLKNRLQPCWGSH